MYWKENIAASGGKVANLAASGWTSGGKSLGEGGRGVGCHTSVLELNFTNSTSGPKTDVSDQTGSLSAVEGKQKETNSANP